MIPGEPFLSTLAVEVRTHADISGCDYGHGFKIRAPDIGHDKTHKLTRLTLLAQDRYAGFGNAEGKSGYSIPFHAHYSRWPCMAFNKFFHFDSTLLSLE